MNNGQKAFGFFEGTPYGVVSDTVEDMRILDLEGLETEQIRKHIKTLPLGMSSEYTNDLFGEGTIQCGVYEDGQYLFPTDYVQYLFAGHVGLPKEYADYLKSIL